MNYYIYFKKDNDWYYDRTCGVEWAAKERVKYIIDKYKYKEAIYMINRIMKNAFY